MTADRHPLLLTAPPARSDHGLPLGAGLLGATVWGDGAPLRLSLDRGDLWDLRPVPDYAGPDYRWDATVAAHRAGRHAELIARLEAPYDRPAPTKLPAGRLELDCRTPATRFHLDRARALATVTLARGARVEAFVDAERLVGRLRLSDPDTAIRLIPPPFGGPPPGWQGPTGLAARISKGDVWELGYPAPLMRAERDGVGFVQAGWGGFAFAVACAWVDGPEGRTSAWTIEVQRGGAQEVAARELEALLARSLATARDAAAEPFEAALARHAAWWADYWRRGAVELPDPELEALYVSGLYLFGAAARRGAPPAPLQGPWTSDDGRLPPWKGDYHHNLNTQMTYWPAYTGNQLEAAAGFVDWLWETRAAARDWTRQFFGVEGLNVPMTADLRNRQIGGWRQHSHALSTAAWLAEHFRLHWRYTGDRAFLADRAYPYVAEVARFLDAISAARGPDGLRRVALSASPEFHDNRPEAWFETWTTYDLTLFRSALATAAELADELGRTAEAAAWRALRAEFPVPAAGPDGGFPIAQGVGLDVSHRHFSHALALYPLEGLRPLERPEEAALAEATLDRLAELGTGLWMGYSFGWYACLLARAGRGAAAAEALRTFARAFTFPNGFHTNGDWRGAGHGLLRFGVFTLEGNSAAAAGVQEMLLQSGPGFLRLFPALPPGWRSAAFHRFRADGALEVSARLADGVVELLCVSPTALELRLAAGVGPARTVTLAQGETRLTLDHTPAEG